MAPTTTPYITRVSYTLSASGLRLDQAATMEGVSVCCDTVETNTRRRPQAWGRRISSTESETEGTRGVEDERRGSVDKEATSREKETARVEGRRDNERLCQSELARVRKDGGGEGEEEEERGGT